MKIIVDDLLGKEIADFLEEHIKDMKSISSPESKHALDLDGLRKPDITFWTVWEENVLVGCGAIKELSREHGELKSMRTSKKFRGKGVASKLLTHIVNEACKRGYQRLSLESGSMEYFIPAHALYESFGFNYCPPFGDYKEDPNSVFMSKLLQAP